ncbi:hypothetical protein ACYF6T_04455 [Streptomyces sp. 7R007]
MAIALSVQDKATLRTAAWGAVSLMAAAGAAGSAHRVATHGSVALTSATGAVGRLLAERGRVTGLGGRSVAELAERVLPALTETMGVLRGVDPVEADNFRGTVLVAVEAAARGDRREPGPALVEMGRKITQALDAA